MYGGKLRKHAKYQGIIMESTRARSDESSNQLWDKNKRKKIYYLKKFWVLVGH